MWSTEFAHARKDETARFFFLKEKHEWRKAKAEWSYELKLFSRADIRSILISRRKMNTIILTKRTVAWKIRMQASTREWTMVSWRNVIFVHGCLEWHVIYSLQWTSTVCTTCIAQLIHHAFSFPRSRNRTFTFGCWLKGRMGVHVMAIGGQLEL